MAGFLGGASLPERSGRRRRSVLERIAALGTARRDGEAAPRPPPPPARRMGAACAADAARAGPHRRDLAGRAGRLRRLRRRHRGHGDDARSTQLMHEVLFRHRPGAAAERAGRARPDPHRRVPRSAAGWLIGAVGLAIVRWRPRRAVDPIEANALYGGRMSLNDSLIVVGQTMLSNGVGASVGLEAGYTQIGSALASRLGRSVPGAAQRPARCWSAAARPAPSPARSTRR